MVCFRAPLAGGRAALLADGAVGTELLKQAEDPAQPLELLNIERPDRVLALHRAYLAAGAHLILTNTLGASEERLGANAAAANQAAVAIARDAVERFPGVVVGGSIGVSAERPCGSYAAQARELAAADVLFLEAATSLDALETALRGVRQATLLPVVCLLSFDASDRLGSLSPAEVARALVALAPDAFGYGCGHGPDRAERALAEMRGAAPDATLVAKPNLGLPGQVGGRLVYDWTPQMTAEWAGRMVALGVQIVGACCGSTPEHVAAMAAAVSSCGR